MPPAMFAASRDVLKPVRSEALQLPLLQLDHLVSSLLSQDAKRHPRHNAACRRPFGIQRQGSARHAGNCISVGLCRPAAGAAGSGSLLHWRWAYLHVADGNLPVAKRRGD